MQGSKRDSQGPPKQPYQGAAKEKVERIALGGPAGGEGNSNAKST